MFSKKGKNLHFKRKLDLLVDDDCEFDSSLDETESKRVLSRVPLKGCDCDCDCVPPIFASAAGGDCKFPFEKGKALISRLKSLVCIRAAKTNVFKVLKTKQILLLTAALYNTI